MSPHLRQTVHIYVVPTRAVDIELEHVEVVELLGIDRT